MLYYAYKIVIDCGIRAPGHGKYVVDGLSATDKGFISMLMTTVQISDAATNDSQMVMYTSISNTDISLSRQFKNIFQAQHVQMDLLIIEMAGNELVSLN